MVGDRSRDESRNGQLGTPSGRRRSLESNEAGALAYLFGAVTGALVLVVDDGDDFVQFHAIQSIALTFAVLMAYMLTSLSVAALSAVPVVGGPLGAALAMLYPVFGVIAIAAWLLSMYRAYEGRWFRLPVVGIVPARSRAAPERLRR